VPRCRSAAFTGFADVQICLCEFTHISTTTQLGEDSKPPNGS
jgi:hypothetical protein